MPSLRCALAALITGLVGCASIPKHDLPSVLKAQEDPLLDGARSARIVVFKGKERLVEANFGEVSGAAPTSKSLYTVGSVSKLLTATAVMQQVQAGRIDLDAPLLQYLPELRIRPVPGSANTQLSKITVRQVLHHHAGFPTDHYHRLVGPGRYAYQDYLTALAEDHLVSRPGEIYTYSNVGYTLLGILIERAAGSLFHAHMAKAILGPAGMLDSGFDPKARDKTRTAPLPDDEALLDMAVVPAGGLWTTADDMARFGRAFLDGTLISEAQRKEMWRVQTTLPIDGGFRQGLGWYRFDAPLDVGEVWGHNGATLQARATLLIAPEHDLIVAVTAAGVVDTSAAAMRVLAAAAGKPFRAPRIEPTDVRRFAGRWQAGDFGSLVLKPTSGNALRTSFGGYTVELAEGKEGGYEPSVKLLGFITFKPSIFKGQRYTFARVADENIIISLRGGAAVTGGFRVPKFEVPKAWRARTGKWSIINEEGGIYSAFDLRIAKDGALILRASFGEDVSIDYALEPVDERHARVAGRGRDLGMVLRAEKQDEMVFSGYRLRPAPRE